MCPEFHSYLFVLSDGQHSNDVLWIKYKHEIQKGGDCVPDNLLLKRKLIMQSFAPLFLILFVKYYDCELFRLLILFAKILIQTPTVAFGKAIQHPMFITMLLEIFCLLWVLYSVYAVRSFNASQRANFTSQGESLVNIEKIPDSGVTFFMTYVLPMAMDELNTGKGILVFGILMIMLFLLMWKTNLYYQNPVLTILGYEIFSFQFESTQMREYRNKECIGITRGTVRTEHSIKRQRISDNVFLVYEDRR